MGAAIATCAASSLCECAACCGLTICTAVMNWTMSQARRVSHFLILLVIFSLAIFLGRSYATQINDYKDLSKIDLTYGCDSMYLSECMYRQLIYRASLSLFLLYTVLAMGSAFFDQVDKSFWPLKFAVAIGVFIAFFWDSNDTFSKYAEFARVISFLWLVVQGLLMLDLSHGAHDAIMKAASDADARAGGDSRGYLCLYLFLSVSMLACAAVGLAYLFQNYASCDQGMFFTVATLILGILTTLISLLQVVNKGLLTPCICFAYSVFTCWYSLLSSTETGCNPSASINNSAAKDISVVITSLVTLTVLLVCVCYGARLLTIFDPQGESLIESGSNNRDLEVILVGSKSGQSKRVGARGSAGSDDIQATKLPYTEDSGSDGEDNSRGSSDAIPSANERVFFHVLMALASAYGAMILTSWGRTNGAPELFGTSVVSNESMWLKIVSQWIFLALYLKMLHVAYADNR